MKSFFVTKITGITLFHHHSVMKTHFIVFQFFQEKQNSLFAKQSFYGYFLFIFQVVLILHFDAPTSLI